MRFIKKVFKFILVFLVILVSFVAIMVYRGGSAIAKGVDQTVFTYNNPEELIKDMEIDPYESAISQNKQATNNNSNRINVLNDSFLSIKSDLTSMYSDVSGDISDIKDRVEYLITNVSDIISQLSTQKESMEASRKNAAKSDRLIRSQIEQTNDDLSDVSDSVSDLSQYMIELDQANKKRMDSLVADVASKNQRNFDKAEKDREDAIAAERKRLSIVNAKSIQKFQRKLLRTNSPEKIQYYTAIIASLKGE